MKPESLDVLRNGTVIPAHPLAINKHRQLDEKRQRALCRYYLASGVGGLAVGVHTTQFAIRDAKFHLLEPVLRIAAEEMDRCNRPLVKIGGVCGHSPQAMREAELIQSLGYDAALLSLGSLRTDSLHELIVHCRRVSELIPIVGFYLQPSVGGRILPYEFWRAFVEIPNVVAIKIAPFNRYQTIDVVRAVIEAERDDIALYTGNDDNIVADMMTPFSFGGQSRRIVGGLLGHWAVWTHRAVQLHRDIQMWWQRRDSGSDVATQKLLELGVQITDCNAAFFDAANGFRGCIAGLHEVLRRQGLLEGIWCLDDQETLSPGQLNEIDRVYKSYPHLHDDDFVTKHRQDWLGSTHASSTTTVS